MIAGNCTLLLTDCMWKRHRYGELCGVLWLISIQDAGRTANNRTIIVQRTPDTHLFKPCARLQLAALGMGSGLLLHWHDGTLLTSLFHATDYRRRGRREEVIARQQVPQHNGAWPVATRRYCPPRGLTHADSQHIVSQWSISVAFPCPRCEFTGVETKPESTNKNTGACP